MMYNKVMGTFSFINVLDVVAIVFVVVFVIIGFVRGFLKSVFSLVGLILGVSAAVIFSAKLGGFIGGLFGFQEKLADLLSESFFSDSVFQISLSGGGVNDVMFTYLPDVVAKQLSSLLASIESTPDMTLASFLSVSVSSFIFTGLAFVLIMALVSLAVMLVYQIFKASILKIKIIGGLNRVLGGILYLILAFFNLYLALLIASFFGPNVAEMMDQSFFLGFFYNNNPLPFLLGKSLSLLIEKLLVASPIA